MSATTHTYGHSVRACELLDALADLLSNAIDDARAPVTSLAALAQWGERRIRVHEQMHDLERLALQAVGAISKTPTNSAPALSALEQVDEEAADAVRARLAVLRTLTAELDDADAHRLALVSRCALLVREYACAINPPIRAYGRSGARTSDAGTLRAFKGSVA